MTYYTTLDSSVKRYEEGIRKFAFHAGSREEYEDWKRALRKRLTEITGMNRCQRADEELNFLEEEMDEGYLRRSYTIQTEPGVRMPFWLYLPETARSAGQKKDAPKQNGNSLDVNLPVMLIPHGHGGGRETVRAGQWNFVTGLLNRGFAVLCPDARGSGERREKWLWGDEQEKKRMNVHRELTQIALGFGQCVLGLQVWDLMRLLDALEFLPGLCTDGIWCAGMSGGGMQTLWLAALDDRVAGVFLSGYFYGMLESLVKLPMNCACNFVPHMWETADMGDLAALIAPRPLFIESGELDPLTGAPGLNNVRPQVEIAAGAYRLFGKEENLVHSVHPKGHEWVGTGMLEFMDRMRGSRKW